MIKDYQLKKGDKVITDKVEYTFIKMDGMYAKWSTKEDPWVTGNFGDLEKVSEGVYKPIEITK